MNNQRNEILLFFLVFLTVVSGCKNNSSNEENEVTEESSPQYVVDVEAIDYAFKMQSEIKSGWVTFDFENRGHKMHFGMLLRFNKPIDKKDLDTYYKDRTDENFQKLVGEEGLTIVGGPGFHTRGQRSEMTIFLEPGDYLMSCNTQTVDGTPHYELGMEKFFKVREENSGADVPEADLELFLNKYFIEAQGELKSGRQTIAVDHAGGDSFDVHLVKLNDTSTIASSLKFMDILKSPSKAIFSGGAEQKMTESKSYITVDFVPGDYAWISHEYGAMGMIKKFQIPEDGNSRGFEKNEEASKKVDVKLTEDNISIASTIDGGKTTFVLNDETGEEHSIRMLRMEKGKSIKDFLEFTKEQLQAMKDENSEFDKMNPTLGYYVSFTETDSAQYKKLELNLNPGKYGLVCFHKNEDKDYDHLWDGEFTSFEVAE